MADAWDQFPDLPKPQGGADPWAHFPDGTGPSIAMRGTEPGGQPEQPTATTAPDAPLNWRDVPGQALNNLGPSAYHLAGAIANTVLHPIDTAKGIYDVGEGAVSKAESALGIEQDPHVKAQREQPLNAVIDFFKDRYGGMDNLKKTIATDPAGFAMDLSTVLTGGETALARLPGVVGKAGEIAGDVSRAVNPVTAAGKVVTGIPVPKTGLNVGVEPIISNVLGMTTGAGAQPIRTAAKAGAEGSQTFLDNMRGNVPLTDVVDQAKDALSGMRQDRSAAYKADMAAANQATGHVGYQPIHQAITNADQMVNFQGLAKSDDALRTLQDIKDKVLQWRGLNTPYTVEAVDALKQAIGEIRQKTQPGTLERKVADTVYNAAKSSIVQQAPEYARAMKDYSDASEKINELTKTFSLGEKASKDTSLRKLQSVMRNNVNTNYGQRTKLLDELAKYEPELPGSIAGQALSSVTPRGFASLGAIGLGSTGVAVHGLPALLNPSTLAAAPFFSPRLVGEAAYKAGQAARVAEPVTDIVPSAAKAAYFGSLVGGIGPRYDANGNLLVGQ